MRRRDLLATLGTAGIVGTAGCSSIRSARTLSDPSIRTDAPARKSIHFTAGGEEVGHFGVDGSVGSGTIRLDTEIWHREGTRVRSIELRVWMPKAGDTPAEIAVVSPVEGDSSPPPSISLSAPRRAPGTVIAVGHLDDLADETISTLDLLVRPVSETATAVAIDATIDLAGGGLLGPDYVLDGRLRLSFPELARE